MSHFSFSAQYRSRVFILLTCLSELFIFLSTLFSHYVESTQYVSFFDSHFTPISCQHLLHSYHTHIFFHVIWMDLFFCFPLIFRPSVCILIIYLVTLIPARTFSPKQSFTVFSCRTKQLIIPVISLVTTWVP